MTKDRGKTELVIINITTSDDVSNWYGHIFVSCVQLQETKLQLTCQYYLAEGLCRRLSIILVKFSIYHRNFPQRIEIVSDLETI